MKYQFNIYLKKLLSHYHKEVYNWQGKQEIIERKFIDYFQKDSKIEEHLNKGKIKDNILREVLNINGISMNQLNRITGINRRLLKK